MGFQDKDVLFYDMLGFKLFLCVIDLLLGQFNSSVEPVYFIFDEFPGNTDLWIAFDLLRIEEYCGTDGYTGRGRYPVKDVNLALILSHYSSPNPSFTSAARAFTANTSSSPSA